MAQQNNGIDHGNTSSKEGGPQSDPPNAQQLNSEFAKALQELARGEQTASVLESRLDDIEGRIEQLLASVEQSAREATATENSQPAGSTDSKTT